MTRRSAIRPARTALVLGAAGALVVSLPGAAAAQVTVSVGGGGIFVTDTTGAPADNTIVATCTGGEVRVQGVDRLPCADLEQLKVVDRSGADTIDLSALTPALVPGLGSTTIETADDFGEDLVLGSQLSDDITSDGTDDVVAGGGNDVVRDGNEVSGGAGDDVIIGARRADGGLGDDVVRDPGTGPFQGGEGFDTFAVDYSTVAPPEPWAPVFTITDSSWSLVVGNDSGSVSIASFERTELTLTDRGTERVGATGFTGSLVLHGRDGADVVRSGPGDDQLTGGKGDDQLAGGPGNDWLSGGGGNDVVDARDGTVDVVRCGDGIDRAVVDLVDIATGCETLVLPPPTTGKVSGPKRVTKGRTASYRFNGTGATGFQCKVDKRPWKACASPYRLSTKKLKPGKHVLRVRAVGRGGVDATPSVRKLRVRRP